MSKIIDAQDILAEEADPIQAVANIASRKIEDAVALLDEYRESVDAPGQAPAAKPESAAARTRKSRK
jgi:hypothetical protein